MMQTKSQRLNYHPSFDREGNLIATGKRKIRGRFEAICSEIDLRGKRVLDLGCSGGAFTFAMAALAEEVIGVDADTDVIKTNRVRSKSLNISNVRFIEGRINRKLLQSIGRFDVVLFLSVFHHMLVSSDAYSWNTPNAQNETRLILESLRDISPILVFEMGGGDEGFSWSGDVARIVDDQPEWIKHNVFGSDFSTIRVIESPSFPSKLRAFKAPLHYLVTKKENLAGRVTRKLTGVEPRDYRNLYIGYK